MDRRNKMAVNSKEIVIDAVKENLPAVLEFIDSQLEEIDCPIKVQMQMDIAVEEIYINIANYAYSPGIGKATIKVGISDDNKGVSITFIDNGVPYNPLEKDDPDITLSAEERAIGGLGIFMVKKSMDDMIYEYKEGQNILTIIKNLG
jgi:anti-sigma regulatory factor (Ser/Thr protein kinase)